MLSRGGQHSFVVRTPGFSDVTPTVLVALCSVIQFYLLVLAWCLFIAKLTKSKTDLDKKLLNPRQQNLTNPHQQDSKDGQANLQLKSPERQHQSDELDETSF